MKRLLILATLLIAQAIPATAQSREKGLDPWMERSLIPYVRQQLMTHPRFKDETVMFVVLKDNAPTPTTNALALSLRDRLLEAAVDTPGITIGWQQGRQPVASTPTDCVGVDVQYYVGLELNQDIDGRYSVNVRALDLNDRTWVTGFGRRWQGTLGTTQRQALRQQRVDTTFLGVREVPFTEDQTDLLAAHLARELTCALQRELEDDYVVSATPTDGVDALASAIELISNNLASNRSLTLTPDREAANAVLQGKAHRIDGDLFQYWLTITPEPGASSLTALSASAYIVLPDTATDVGPQSQLSAARNTATPRVSAAPRTVSIPNAGGDGLIGRLQVSPPRAGNECRPPCSVLRATANTDAMVFFLEHQPSYGLVRLAGNECRRRATPRLARRGDELRFAVRRTIASGHSWHETVEWHLDPKHNTYYAVVVTDADVARSMANLIDRLPQRCGDSLRPGARGSELEAWMHEFAAFTADASGTVDWRAVRVDDVM